MTNMTLSIPKDLYIILRRHSEVKWSEVARRALWEQARKLELMEELLKDSKLTEENVDEISNLIKDGIATKHGLK
jgi:hypothetical protein